MRRLCRSLGRLQKPGPPSLTAARTIPIRLQAAGRSRRFSPCSARDAEALPIAQQAAEAQAAHPDRGPNHPDTLAGRWLVARILSRLGRTAEALPIARQIA